MSFIGWKCSLAGSNFTAAVFSKDATTINEAEKNSGKCRNAQMDAHKHGRHHTSVRLPAAAEKLAASQITVSRTVQTQSGAIFSGSNIVLFNSSLTSEEVE